jgi:uncharacterized protein DUF4124
MSAPRVSQRLRRVLRTIALAAALVPAFVHAGVYKCARADGSPFYQEDPCPPGKELRNFERDPATVSVVPFEFAPSPNASTATRAPSAPAKSKRTSSASRKTGDHPGNPAERKFLVPGIGEGEVVARVGRPDMSTGSGRKTTRWTYLPVPEDPQMITTLTFELGRLVEVERKMVR